MTRNKLSDEDKALFRSETGDVKPLTRKNSIAATPQKKPVFKQQADHEPPRSPTPQPHLSDFIAEPQDSESILSWSNNSLAARDFSLLKQGKLRHQTHLDLHGLNRDEAAHELYQFIKHSQQQGYRCVKLIHGTGGRKGEAPIIKNLINQWLRQLNEVLAFHSCLPADGGSGAVYILLRRISP